jgi:hypothetical protein
VITVLIHVLIFGGGFVSCDLVRIGQERYRLRQAVRFTVQQAGSPDKVLRLWSHHPANRCDPPGCPRCHRRWGR